MRVVRGEHLKRRVVDVEKTTTASTNVSPAPLEERAPVERRHLNKVIGALPERTTKRQGAWAKTLSAGFLERAFKPKLKKAVVGMMLGLSLLSSLPVDAYVPPIAPETVASLSVEAQSSPLAMRIATMVEAQQAAEIDVVESGAEIKAMVKEIIEESFPELVGKDISFEFFESDAYFFRSRPKVGSVLNPFVKTKYVVDINRAIFDMALPDDAARAILAHELAHTLCYVEGGIAGMVGTLAGELSQGHQEHVERHTDLVAMQRGYGPGLAAYREWIYAQLKPNDLAEKQATYFTPAEIELIDAAAASDPAVYTSLLKRPPRNLEQTQSALEALQNQQ